jgi:HAD superfamily hydrolase (TIGR01509 family)
VVRALCEPAAQRIQLFPGTRELLLAQRQLGLRCVVLSNTTFRGTAEYWQDFRDFGVAELLDGVITSMDVGYRKPHPAIFEAAVAEAGCQPSACVMVGNSEQNDVEPAVALGMCAIRVAIEEPQLAHSAAHAVASSLEEVIAILRRWAEGERCPPARGAAGGRVPRSHGRHALAASTD